jgi:HD-like signal output (HDOD) protein
MKGLENTLAILTASRFLGSLPSFSPIAARLMGLTEQASMGTMSELISTDPALTSDVLRLANSALFARQREVDSVLQAMTMLGMNRVRGLVLTVALRDFSVSATLSPVFQQCWRHCLACGLIAADLAEVADKDRNAGYTLGLLHDAGRLALLAAKPLSYGRLLKAGAANATEMCAEERELFEVDHCETGGWLAETWRLPLNFQIAMRHHHHAGSESRGYQQIVHLACQLASMAGFQSWGQPPAWDTDALQTLRAPGSTEILDAGQLIEHVTTEINSLERMLAP